MDAPSPPVLLVPFRIAESVPEPDLAVPHAVLRPTLPPGVPQARLGALCAAIAERTAAMESPVVYIGDCVLTLGVLAGLQRRGVEPTFVWLDAHGDFNTWETTPSGFLGGMPLAMAVGRGEQTIVEAAGLQTFPEARVVLVDARDLDPGEDRAVAESRMRHVSVGTLGTMPLPDGPLYVHLDVDIVDPEEMPAVSYPAPGGPSASAVREVIARLAGTRRICAFSVTMWEPALSGADRSAAAARALVEPVVG